MDKDKLINHIENEKQVGVSMIIKCIETDMYYAYAIQKRQNQYIVYINEICLDMMYADEMEDTEQVFIYSSFSEVMEHFHPKYSIRFEDLGVSKGQKFFNPELYR